MDNPTLLIVEDDGILAANLGLLVGSLGYQVLGPVATGEEALNLLDRHSADLVLMDIALGGRLNGIETAESITRTLYSRARESARFTTNPSKDVFHLTLEEHRRVLEAIEAGDAAAAESAMRAHILDAWQRRRQPTARKP